MKRLISMLALMVLMTALFVGTVAQASNNPLNIHIPEETTVVTTDDADDEEEVIEQTGSGYEDWDTDKDNGALADESGFNDEELYLAAQLIYAEGKKQSDESFLAMASVVYNRVKSKKFPATIEKVVFQKNQFTVTRDKEKFLKNVPSKAARSAIYTVFVEGKPTLPPEVMFFKSARLSQKWGKRVYYDTIGSNMYYS